MPTIRADSRISIYEGENAIMVGRVYGANRTLLTDTLVTAYELNVYEWPSATPATPYYSAPTASGATAFFSALQTGYADELGDNEGYNFLYVLADADANLSGGKSYIADFACSVVGFDTIRLIFTIDVKDVFSHP